MMERKGAAVGKQGQRELPHFRYHPSPLKTGYIQREDSAVCEVCGEATGYVYTGALYAPQDEADICPWCLASGAAAQKLDGRFVARDWIQPPVADDILDEITLRTPSYRSVQQESWRTHCDDGCAFLGEYTWAELEELGVAGEIARQYAERPEDFRYTLEQMQSGYYGGGWIEHYLFQCLHCGKYLLQSDMD